MHLQFLEVYHRYNNKTLCSYYLKNVILNGLFVRHPIQRQSKYKDNKLKALKARNEYLLNLDAANVSVNKYYRDDLPNLIDVCVILYMYNYCPRCFKYFWYNLNFLQCTWIKFWTKSLKYLYEKTCFRNQLHFRNLYREIATAEEINDNRRGSFAVDEPSLNQSKAETEFNKSQKIDANPK